MFSKILSAYGIKNYSSVQSIGTGLIHNTFEVITDNGCFVLQKLHDVISDAAVVDMATVGNFLSNADVRVPVLLQTINNEYLYRDSDGKRWRMYPWLDGKVFDVVSDEKIAHSAAQLVGKVHRILQNCPYEIQGSIPHFHETEIVLKQLEEIFHLLPEELKQIAETILTQLPNIILSEEFGKRQIIHGDLKISNILFDDHNCAVGILDFDTLLFHHRGIDIGDAFRSWCNVLSEDEKLASFDTHIFSSALQGYEYGYGEKVSDVLCLRATKQIALELTSRFLIDVVRDTYFGFDAHRYATRREHNIARVKGQYAFAQSIHIE